MTRPPAGGLQPQVLQGVGSDTGTSPKVPQRSHFDTPDALHEFGPYVIRRAQPSDALDYCRTDAQMVASSYPGVMPAAWSEDRLAEADGLAMERERAFAANLAAEARGEVPQDRTWLALEHDAIVGICVSRSTPQDWESINEVHPIPGVSQQLNHLYLRPSAQGTGLADTLMELALPGRMPAYLWIIGGNARGWRFYERHGFVGDGITYSCGPIWYDMPLFRMYRT
jgi:GNAT superfamily N-acetyltransferase